MTSSTTRKSPLPTVLAGSDAGRVPPLVGMRGVSTMDIEVWVAEATDVELRAMRRACEEKLRLTSYVCRVCEESIPTALPRYHPAHKRSCPLYQSMVTY